MKYIDNPEDLKGKTIKSVFYNEERLMIEFEDGDRLSVFANRGFGGPYVAFSSEECGIPMIDKRDAGWVTKEEYQVYEQEWKAEAAENRKKEDLAQLARLQAKYGNDPTYS